MPIDSYLNQTATRAAKTGLNKFGKPTESAAVSFECRLINKQKRRIDEQGKEYQTDGELWVKPAQSIEIDDKITLESINYRVVGIDTERGLTGAVHHKKAYLVRTKE